MKKTLKRERDAKKGQSMGSLGDGSRSGRELYQGYSATELGETRRLELGKQKEVTVYLASSCLFFLAL